jgi:hypothetical protein
MQSAAWYLNRLRSMGSAEIVWRVRSLLRDQIDLIRYPLGVVPRLSADSFPPLVKFKPSFSCTEVDAKKWATLESATRQRWTERLEHNADQVLQNRLSYFELADHFHGARFNWHRDHSADKDCPVRHTTLTDYRDFGSFGDCKLVWEPNRHHQLVVLARAYVVTGERKYAVKAVELMKSWMDANPFGYGMNWKSPLELGVRLINWVWTIDLLRNAGVFDEKQWDQTLNSCYLAMWDAHRKLSRGSSANNHLIGEAAGVYFAARYFSMLPNASRWASDSKAVLEREIISQTYPDGCTREHAFGYQFFVLQFLCSCILAGEDSGDSFSRKAMDRVHRMFRFMKKICAGTSVPPHMGDKDDGYVLNLGELPNTPDSLIAVGAAMFADDDLKALEPSESAFWLTGNVANLPQDESDSPNSVNFPESGYSILRGILRQDDKRVPIFIFFDAADLGYGPIAAHGHADALSFCMSIGGDPVFVDAGTYDYFSYPAWRNYFRSTKAHNTVEIDDRSQSESKGAFLWDRKASCKLIDWVDDESATAVTAEHDGYTSLQDPAIHRRELRFDKQSGETTVTDTILSNGPHDVCVRLHVHPEFEVSQISNQAIQLDNSGHTIIVTIPDVKLSLARASEENMVGWISDSYHRKTPSCCIEARRKCEGTTIITTNIACGRPTISD